MDSFIDKSTTHKHKRARRYTALGTLDIQRSVLGFTPADRMCPEKRAVDWYHQA